MQLVVLNLAVNRVSSASTIVSALFFCSAGSGVCFEWLRDRLYLPLFIKTDSEYLLWQMVCVCLFVRFLHSLHSLAVVSNESGDSPACEEGCGESRLLFRILLRTLAQFAASLF